MMTEKQPTNAEIRECHEQAQADIELTCHESQGESMSDIDSAHDHRGILLERLEEAEHNLLETHVAWQQGIKRIKELEAMSDRVTTVINDINPVALIGKPSYHPMCEMINEVRYKLKAILEDK